MKKLTIILLSLSFSIQFFGQEKFEREYRVKEDEVPKIALDFTNAINFKKRLKWYAEESNDGKTFEAKVYYKKHLYSIEFLDTGALLDIEKKVRFKKLNNDISEKIIEYLNTTYTKFRIKKTQIQFKGTTKELKQIFTSENDNTQKFIEGFELIVKAKKDKKYKLYELFFDVNGTIKKTLNIVPSNSLNLEF